MDDFLRRRSLMGAGPVKPYPYSIDPWENVSYTSMFDSGLTKWNQFRIDILSTSTGNTLYLNLITGGNVKTDTPYLTIPNGSTVLIRLINISNSDSMPIEFAALNGSNTVMSIARFTDATDKTVSATVAANTPIDYLRIAIVRTGIVAGNSFSCDIELYVDGERWI